MILANLLFCTLQPYLYRRMIFVFILRKYQFLQCYFVLLNRRQHYGSRGMKLDFVIDRGGCSTLRPFLNQAVYWAGDFV